MVRQQAYSDLVLQLASESDEVVAHLAVSEASAAFPPFISVALARPD
mgnify:FL=1